MHTNARENPKSLKIEERFRLDWAPGSIFATLQTLGWFQIWNSFLERIARPCHPDLQIGGGYQEPQNDEDRCGRGR